VQVLLHLDAASVGSTGDYPLAWAQSFGAGRSYYNALGHFSETWNDNRFQRQLGGRDPMDRVEMKSTSNVHRGEMLRSGGLAWRRTMKARKTKAA
jgi:type 1 glutamine amidotransferase